MALTLNGVLTTNRVHIIFEEEDQHDSDMVFSGIYALVNEALESQRIRR